jgi:hypothetical protein
MCIEKTSTPNFLFESVFFTFSYLFFIPQYIYRLKFALFLLSTWLYPETPISAKGGLVWFGFIVFNATFNNILAVSFIGKGNRVPGENHRPVASH